MTTLVPTGTQKAWVGAALALVSSFIMQQLNLGEGPSPADVATLVDMTKEIGVSVVNAVIAYVAVWAVPNTTTLKP